MTAKSSNSAHRPVTGFLGAGTRTTGDLVFEGRFRVDGDFSGRIYSDDVLEVGVSGRVEGVIDVAEAIIAGFVEGEVRVRQRLMITGTAEIRGVLHTPERVVVRRGARVTAKVVEGSFAAGPPA
jgi:cytoskeletal protein CcmA (bactofilin family)